MEKRQNDLKKIIFLRYGWRRTGADLFQNPRAQSVGFLLSAALSAAFLFLIASVCFIAVCHAETSKAMVSSEVSEKPFGERKMLRGFAGARNSEGIALVYFLDEATHTEKEKWFPLTPDVRLGGYNSLEEIVEGDEIIVTYEEDENGTKRVLREINFVQHKPQAPLAEESSE